MRKPFGLLYAVAIGVSVLQFPVPAAAQSRFAGVCEITSAVVQKSSSLAWATISASGGTCTGALNGVPGTYSIDIATMPRFLVAAEVPVAGSCVAVAPSDLAVFIGGSYAGGFDTFAVIQPAQAYLTMSGSGTGMGIFDPTTTTSAGPCGVTGTLRLSFGPDSVGIYVPGQHVFQGLADQETPEIDPIPVTTPAVGSIPVGNTPEIQSITVTTPPVAPIAVATPGVPSLSVATPPVTVPFTCTPANIICVGPFTIPSQPVTTTPSVPSQPVATTPPVESESASTPAVPSMPVATPGVPAETIVSTPSIGPIEVTPSVGFAVTLDNTEAWLDPNVGSFIMLEPTTVEVPTPFGPVPVTVCASTCPIPANPMRGVMSGVTLMIRIGSETNWYTVPINVY